MLKVQAILGRLVLIEHLDIAVRAQHSRYVVNDPSKLPEISQANVIIVGGGLIGLSLAIALARAHLAVIVIDQEDPATVLDASFDGRVSAIADASHKALVEIGVWKHIREAQPIWDIRVSDGDSLFFLHYDHRDLGDRPFGQIVENRILRQALHTALAECPTLRLIAPGTYRDIVRDGQGVSITLANGERLMAALLVAADGRNSTLRQMAGIRTTAWTYAQTGIVCTVEHERDHHGIAQERFLPAGPFAILPMTGNRSSLVWTERADLAPALLSLPEGGLHAEMARRFGDYLGDLKITGPRWSYPLSLHHAERYVDQRLALIGDAAHGIHPIAGQGLNLGLRDVAALAEVLVDAHRLGLDLGQLNILQRYERWRRFDNVLLAAVTDLLNRLFSNDIPPVKLARDLGLALVNRLTPVKRFLMRHARGSVGNLPRLLQGRPL